MLTQIAFAFARAEKDPNFARKVLNATARMYLRTTLSSGRDERSSRMTKQITKEIWKRAGDKLGIPVEEAYGMLWFRGSDGRLLRVRWEGSSLSCESQMAGDISGDKVLTAELLREAGVCVPEGRSFPPQEEEAAISYAMSIQPCVAKPARWTDYGVGVTLQPLSRKAIRRAFRFASLYSPEVRVERFIAGDNYRFLVYRGRCLSVVLRDVAHVVGDGSSTVLELAQRENSIRIRDYTYTGTEKPCLPLPTGQRAGEVLRRQGLQWTSVLQEGRKAQLWDVSNFQFGTSYREVLGEANAEIVRAAERAADLVGAVVAGVDVIAPDVRQPVYVVNEVNTNPAIWLHYGLDYGRNPARAILQGELGIRTPEGETRNPIGS